VLHVRQVTNFIHQLYRTNAPQTIENKGEYVSLKDAIMSDKSTKEIIHDYFSSLGKKGGKRSRGGGRPRIPDDQMTPKQKKRRERYLASKKKTSTMEA